MKKNDLLEVKNLKTSVFNDQRQVCVVDDVSFSIYENSVLGLVGESGCGKTMTALSLTKLVGSAARFEISGAVNFNGKDLLSAPAKDLLRVRGRQITYIFQEPSTCLNPVLTVREQMEEVLRLHRKDISRSGYDKFLVEGLEKVGMNFAAQKLKTYPHQLSGGEKQRIMIAMATLSRPKLLIADEPTTALDVTIQAQILVLLHSLKRELGIAMLFISHDLDVIGEIADYIAVMYAGKIVEISPAQKLLLTPKHPYTKGLIDCLPQNCKDEVRRRKVIAGEVPRGGIYPAGCRFHPRCPDCMDKCRTRPPPVFRSKDAEEEVSCWLYSN
ncbi:MAG: ABC transporter ATP-binding protein [Candidatus Omnitrophica bacterium]|nr:ABC transporter ATP-binding protein [Candidatus Omnitrophota bacterium]